MFDQFIYDNIMQNMTAMALHSNDEEARAWRRRRDDWLANAAIEKAIKHPLSPKPRPPAQKATVVAPPWAPGVEQSEIKLFLGPELVDDPACDLPPDPSPLPQGVVDVGALVWLGPPANYARGSLDTAASGQTATKDGRNLVAVQIPSPFGRDGFCRWYQEV